MPGLPAWRAGCLALVFVLVALPAVRASQDMMLDVAARPRAGAYETANFRLWHPDVSRKMRAVLVLVPGANGDGRGAVDAPQWQELARRFDMVIVACHMTGDGYQDPSLGTGEAMDDALSEFGKKVGQKDLVKLPLVMWGHSAGGQFNYNYAQWRPERILAFVVNKGAYYVDARDRKALKVPGMFFLGMKDSKLRIDNITGIYGEGRGQGAPWCLVREPQAGHEVGESQVFALKYFETIIPLRLPAGKGSLQEADLSAGWLGNLENGEIERARGSKWKNDETSWFPSEGLARLWKEIISG